MGVREGEEDGVGRGWKRGRCMICMRNKSMARALH